MIKVMLIIAVIGWIVAFTFPAILQLVKQHKKKGDSENENT